VIVGGMDLGVVLGTATWLVGVAVIAVMALLPWLEELVGRDGGREDR
jgi:hypothetical protein